MINRPQKLIKIMKISNLGQLRNAIEGLSDNVKVVLASDAEGNSYHIGYDSVECLVSKDAEDNISLFFTLNYLCPNLY